MKSMLVGYTGFVGSNLAAKHTFDSVFNSKNISDSFGLEPDLLVYAGVRAEKFLANNEPEKDKDQILNAIQNIKKINPKKLVLISTIDVYKHPVSVNEDTEIDKKELHPYGLNRYYLENWVEDNLDDYLIVRLPGLFGKNIKKNFLYDLINLIPAMLTKDKFLELSNKNTVLNDYYSMQDNGFYKCRQLSAPEKTALRQVFLDLDFTALLFTDSRGIFQFYYLANLWNDIQIALNNNVKKLNIATEPLLVSEIYQAIKNKPFVNEIATSPPKYDFKTKHADLFGGKDGYIASKEDVLADIKKFVETSSI